MWRLLIIASLVAAASASAQTNLDDEWNTLPPDAPGQPPLAPRLPDAPPPPAPVTPADRDDRPTRPSMSVSSPRPVLEPNTVSMFGARSLGLLRRGEMFYLGFPLLGLRFMIGVHDRFDFGVGFDSFYVMMDEVRGVLRFNFLRGTNWALAAVAEGGWAYFTQKASVDTRGARWLTGRRNGNLQGGLTVSYQGDHPRAARLFLSLQYLFTFDTEPFQKDPLGGVPASIQYGHNGLLRAGAEMPLSAKTSFVFLLGLDVHGRPEDAPVMPVCSVGLVTSI